MQLCLEREICGSNLRPVKLDTLLPIGRHCSDISIIKNYFIERNVAEVGTANLLHPSA